MIDHKGSFYLGVFIFIIPFLGFPTMWKMGLVVFGGILLILTSLRVPNPRKFQRPKFKREDEIDAPIVEIQPLEITKPIEPVIIHIPAPAKVIEPPIVRIDKEVKKTRKPRARIVKVDSVRKLDIKQ
jgi:hypothetical protein